MDYIAVPVNDRIELRPKDPSYHPTPVPTAIVSMSVDVCPVRLCIKMEFGNITSICKHMKTFGGLAGGKPVVGSVTCNYDKGSSDLEVTLLVVSSCPEGKRGCISLENGERKKCAYLVGILQPMPTVRLHYSVVCNYPEVRKGNPGCSENVQGPTINVHLLASEKEPEMRERRLPKWMSERKETVLVVDDEDTVITICEEMLTAMGCKVFVAKSGTEALDLYRKKKDEISLVMLDMILPKMSGGSTYDKLKEINPNIKVLLWSGYSIDGQATEILERGGNAFIQKPFSMKELSEKMRAVLDKK